MSKILIYTNVYNFDVAVMVHPTSKELIVPGCVVAKRKNWER